METQAHEMLENFVDQLIIEQGLGETEPAVKTELRNDLHTRLEERLNAEMVAALPVEHVEKLNALIDLGGDGNEIGEFLRLHIPNLQDVVTRTLVDFRSTYLGA